LPSSGARSLTCTFCPTPLRGHKLYVHCSGGSVDDGSMRLSGTLAVNASPSMTMSVALSGVARPTSALLTCPVPLGLIRTMKSHRTFGPMAGVPLRKRGVPEPRLTPNR
jgi:hypothetical protein